LKRTLINLRYFVILDTKISMRAWLEKQVQGDNWYRLGSLSDQADEKSRDETEDNHDIIKLSREALQYPTAAAYCGGCCVTTPDTFLFFCIGWQRQHLMLHHATLCLEFWSI
jgi:hypothetical protein